MQDLSDTSDSRDWLVCGWFTEDDTYRPLAENLAANLAEHDIPFHLFAKPRLGKGWNTHRKPSVVLEAMDAYPGKTIVLMDVDCAVRSDISPLIDSVRGDVALTVSAWRVRLLWPPHKRITIKASSRVVVLRPTEGARAFATEWARQCSVTHYGGDEAAMAQAYFMSGPGTSFSRVDPRYNGVTAAEDSMIVHDSAHEKMPRAGFKNRLKAMEARFRTGRTKASKQAGLVTPSIG